MSPLNKQIKPINTKEVKARAANLKLNGWFKKIEKRIIPSPPNFNKVPAKNIEPKTGASTWALGSHMWAINMGNLTKNAIIVK